MADSLLGPEKSEIDAAVERMKTQQGMMNTVLVDYRKALTLLTEGTRSTLISMGLSNKDALTNLDQGVTWMRGQIHKQQNLVKRATGSPIIKPNGEIKG